MAIDITKLKAKCPHCDVNVPIGKVIDNNLNCPDCGRTLSGKMQLSFTIAMIEALGNAIGDSGVTIPTVPVVEDNTKEAIFEKKLERVRKSLCPECGRWLSETLVVGKNALVAHCSNCGTEVLSV